MIWRDLTKKVLVSVRPKGRSRGKRRRKKLKECKKRGKRDQLGKKIISIKIEVNELLHL